MAAHLEDGLRELVTIQQCLQISTGNMDAIRYSPDKLRLFTLALTTELMELLCEFDWKPWRDNGKAAPDKEKVAEECADVLAFLGTLFLQVCDGAGITTADITRAYERKTEVNHQRIRPARN